MSNTLVGTFKGKTNRLRQYYTLGKRKEKISNWKDYKEKQWANLPNWIVMLLFVLEKQKNEEKKLEISL